MTTPTRSFRLHLDQPLAVDARLALDKDQAHYVVNVMRAGAGDSFLAFNGRDGEWLMHIVEATKRGVLAQAGLRTRPPAPPPDVELWFAPVKKARTDFIVEKATELGARRILPVITRRTNAERVRVERLTALAVEAAEQCGLVFAPSIAEPTPLSAALAALEADRVLHFCDETGGAPVLDLVAASAPAAILIGPEGGFEPEEAAGLRAHPRVRAASLGPRILRADTAAAVALALWQSRVGDWRS